MIRTDLALEAHGLLGEAKNIAGITVKEKESGNAKITNIEIKTTESAQKMGKPIGNYITIELPDITSATPQILNKLCNIISEELASVVEIKKGATTLIAGLGNHSIISDSLGPSVVSKLLVTRHLFSELPDEITNDFSSVSAISPGVLGITGIETVEILKGIVEKTKPSLVIAVDALAAGDIKRIARTVQISDTGINPGAGVKNNRKELSYKTLGVPVISIGIPTVIDAVTIASDVISSAEKNFSKNKGEDLYGSEIDETEIDGFFRENLDDTLSAFIVTPKDIDLLIDKTSSLVADGINMCLHKKLSLDDIRAFLA